MFEDFLWRIFRAGFPQDILDCLILLSFDCYEVCDIKTVNVSRGHFAAQVKNNILFLNSNLNDYNDNGII